MDIWNLQNILSAIESFNIKFLSLPVLIVISALAFLVPLALFFGKGKKWKDTLAKSWIAASFFLLSLFLFEVQNWFNNTGSETPIFFAAAIAYTILGIYFLLDIYLKKMDFSAIESSNQYSKIGLIVSVGGYLLYLLLQLLGGYNYPGMVFYGAELPILGYFIGLLIMTAHRTPKILLAVISIYTLIGGTLAGIIFPYPADYVPAIAGLIGLAVLLKLRKEEK